MFSYIFDLATNCAAENISNPNKYAVENILKINTVNNAPALVIQGGGNDTEELDVDYEGTGLEEEEDAKITELNTEVQEPL